MRGFHPLGVLRIASSRLGRVQIGLLPNRTSSRTPNQTRSWQLALGLALVFAVSLSALAQDSLHRGRKYKAPPPVSHVEVTVVRASNGKPVTDASVIFHPIIRGKDRGNMELKTDSDGKALIDVIETGSTIRLQVIAPDFQTFGQDYKIDKASMSFMIKLKRPGEQYSIYGNDAAKEAPKPSQKAPNQ